MNELLKIEINENQEQTISGRLLHEFLEVGTEYTKWLERKCEYGFEEGVDFNSVISDEVRFEGNREVRRSLQNHELKIDMAKEICMLEKNDKGKQARQYFIQIEKDWNSPEKTMARALLMADKQIKKLVIVNEYQAKQIEADRPKVLFADSVAVTEDTILVNDLAKIIMQNGYQIGEKRLYSWLRDNGYLIKRQRKDYNSPTQRWTEKGLFKISETTINHNSGKVSKRKTTRITGKGEIYFVNLFSKMLESQKAGLIDFEDAKQQKVGAAI